MADNTKRSVHQIKCINPFYNEVAAGIKTFEVRYNDRNYNVGEKVVLYEYDPEKQKHTGRWLTFVISYILPGGQYGIANGYIVMGISELIVPTH